MVNPIQLHVSGRPDRVSAPQSASTPKKTEFTSVFRHALGGSRGVKFSAHALQRLGDQKIELTDSDRVRIAEAIDTAEAKSARESLLLLDEIALVVSVPNRTVITAVEPNSKRNVVFTKIDSVVFVASRDADADENLTE